MDSAAKIGAIISISWALFLTGCDGTGSLASTSVVAAPPVEHLSSKPVTVAVAAPAPELQADLLSAPPTLEATTEPTAEPELDIAKDTKDRPGINESSHAKVAPTEEPMAALAPITPAGEDASEDDVAGSAEPSPNGYPLLGAVVAPGERQQLTWSATETFTGTPIPTAVLVVNGDKPGPTLCLTAAVHGDELNGIETVRRVVHEINPNKLNGTLIAVPIVNLQAFHRHSRYLPDRRDLNRFFPGNPTGSSASRIAHSFFTEVIQHCDGLVDLHTGSFHRTNLPQLRADLTVPEVVELTQGFGATVTLHSEGGPGTLRRAAVDAGIPAVTLEAGAPLRVQNDDVKHAVKSIHTLLDKMGMYAKRSIWGSPEPVYYTSRWVRADTGGVMFGEVKLGKRVRVGDLLGTVTDPITNKSTEIVSPFTGRVLGMALDQFVMPGFATFHIGIETEVDEAAQERDTLEADHTVAVYEPERDQNE
jgi:predicted deacylase